MPLRLGPTLPAFLSPNVVKVLVEKFDIKPIGTVKEDVAAMMAGKHAGGTVLENYGPKPCPA